MTEANAVRKRIRRSVRGAARSAPAGAGGAHVDTQERPNGADASRTQRIAHGGANQASVAAGGGAGVSTAGTTPLATIAASTDALVGASTATTSDPHAAARVMGRSTRSVWALDMARSWRLRAGGAS